jgi:acyl-coenzyme A thioesterase PaaI-like protein
MTPAELEAALHEGFPLANCDVYRVASASRDTLVVHRTVLPVDLRPGAIVSGPVLMDLADSTSWLHVMARHGVAARASLTSDLTMHFLAPARGDLVATCRIDAATTNRERFAVHIASAAGPVALAHVGYVLRREAM